jgi:hypothetical protein
MTIGLQRVTQCGTDGRTDGRTDGQTAKFATISLPSEKSKCSRCCVAFGFVARNLLMIILVFNSGEVSQVYRGAKHRANNAAGNFSFSRRLSLSLL